LQKHAKQRMKSRAFGWKEILSNDFVGARYRSSILIGAGKF
jgi:hypothetical protein